MRSGVAARVRDGTRSFPGVPFSGLWDEPGEEEANGAVWLCSVLGLHVVLMEPVLVGQVGARDTLLAFSFLKTSSLRRITTHDAEG